MEISRAGSRASVTPPASWIRGAARLDPLFSAPLPSRATALVLTFEPGARTAWHSHPLGQILVVTSGCGRIQLWGGPVEEIRPGDVVWIAPGDKHWHGATDTVATTQLAIQEELDGRITDWMEHVA
ncbi:MAG: cupin domain-containing protein [Alsobacter sp.]